jgi:hypothetical protein
MASSFKFQGTDLDLVFAPWHTGWPEASATEFEAIAGDLNTRYATLATGTAAAATDFKTSSAADLNTIFAAYGTTSVIVATQPSAVSGTSAAGNPNGTVTSGSTSCAGSKGKGSYTYTWYFASGSGASFTSGSSASTEVTATVPSNSSISGTMYCIISDGTTFVQTNTVAWSLTNTSPQITVIPYTANGRAALPTTAAAAMYFYSDGTERYSSNASPSPTSIGYWCPAGNGTAYDVMATLASGTTPTGALGTWIELSAAPNYAEWSLSNDSGLGNTVSCTLTIQIRLHSTSTVVASGTIGINVISTGST